MDKFRLTCSVHRGHKSKGFVNRNVDLSRKNTRVRPLLNILPLFETDLRVDEQIFKRLFHSVQETGRSSRSNQIQEKNRYWETR